MIRNKKDLEFAYMAIEIFKDLVNRQPNVDAKLELKRNNYIKDRKKEIREFNKRKRDRRFIKDYGIDGYIELVELPEYLDTKEEAKEYFEEEEWIHCPLTAYDCTGRPFTGWVKIFQRRGKWMAYHRVEFDV